MSHAAWTVADLGTQDYLYSTDSPNQWVCYDFRERRIQLSHYSSAAHTNNWFLRSWVVEGSRDKSNWAVLDVRENDTQADVDHPITTFAVQREITSRFVRLRQTGKCSCNTDALVLVGFEVFGLLMEADKQTKSPRFAFGSAVFRFRSFGRVSPIV
jgi:hypothetical protein